MTCGRDEEDGKEEEENVVGKKKRKGRKRMWGTKYTKPDKVTSNVVLMAF